VTIEPTAAAPVAIVRASDPALASPLVTPELSPVASAYPAASLAAPTPSSLPTDYVPPALRHQNQIATMTPVPAKSETGTDADSLRGPSPRLWLYVGFVGSSLVLIASLIWMVRNGKQAQRMPPEELIEEPNRSDDPRR
jgi:hypothetical protein